MEGEHLKFYGVKRKRIEEKLRYFITKTKFCYSSYLTFDKQKREQRKIHYSHVFVENFNLRDEDLSIPEGKYYTPICILTSDLVLREIYQNYKLD